jgi:hypothetical protein
MSRNRHLASRLCTMPICLAPGSVQLNSQFFRLWGYFHSQKAWMFSDTPAGADASAVIYSLVEANCDIKSVDLAYNRLHNAIRTARMCRVRKGSGYG